MALWIPFFLFLEHGAVSLLLMLELEELPGHKDRGKNLTESAVVPAKRDMHAVLPMAPWPLSDIKHGAR